MAKKKTPAPLKNDFAAEEELDVCGFNDNPIITGDCVASFSFDGDSNSNTSSTKLTPRVKTLSNKLSLQSPL